MVPFAGVFSKYRGLVCNVMEGGCHNTMMVPDVVNHQDRLAFRYRPI